MSVSVKISQLVEGGNVSGADYLPVARGAANTFRIAASQFVVGGQNAGFGSGLFINAADGAGRSLRFRSLSGTDGLQVINVGDTTVISASGQNPVKTSLTSPTVNGTNFIFPVVGAVSINPNNYRVDIDGVLQESIVDYNINGSNIVFTSPPPNGSKVTIVNNNLVRAYDIIPSDGSVTSNKIYPEAVTTDKVALSAVTTDRLALGSVTNAKIAFDGGALGFRNKIINGDMRIDQRYSGSAATSNTTGSRLFMADRFFVVLQSANPFLITAQNITDNSNPQFINYFRTTTTTATNYTGTAAEVGQYVIQHRIEGNDIRNFNFGTPQAKTLTLTFWVRSNYTGTYQVNCVNGPGPFGRLCVSTYQINAANTWEKKTITIPGDTQEFSSWLTNNDLGLAISWGLGVSDIFFTSGGFGTGSWNTRNITTNPRPDISINNASQKLHNKAGAYFDLTGVQLEEGPVATPFEQRPIGLELSLCQRYYETGRIYVGFAIEPDGTSGGFSQAIHFNTSKRTTTPTMSSNFVPGTGDYSTTYFDSWFTLHAGGASFSILNGSGSDCGGTINWTASNEL